MSHFCCETLAHSYSFFKGVSITGNSDSLVSDGEDRTLRTRHRRTFSRVPAHVTVAQDTLPTRVTWTQECVEYFSLRSFKVILSSHVPSQSSWCSRSISSVSVHPISYTAFTAKNGNEREPLCYSARRSLLWTNGRTEPSFWLWAQVAHRSHQ